ncbi:MAG: hypothetical protein U5O39_15960 [Gammaproteobacteria bacterium]|nr:hypothetical protein [Gammaproteobacteria bacterium]
MFLTLQYLASERVEVVELHTIDAADERVTTRLWVVDHGGHPHLRVGAGGSGWYSRLKANPNIQLTRDGKTQAYLAVPRPEKSEVINELMQKKYTWGDTFIAILLGGRDSSIPIELRAPHS